MKYSTKFLLPTLSLLLLSVSHAHARDPIALGYCAAGNANMAKGNYLTEVADHNNTAWIRGTTDMNHSDVYDKMKWAKANGKKIFVDISAVLFKPSFYLYPDYQARWDIFAERVRPYLDSIVAFYPLDEPYLWSKRGYISEKKMTQQLEVIGAMIHNTFPESKIAMVFTARDLYSKNQAIFPKSFDWFGVDCFGSWNDCQGHSMPFYHARIKSQLTGNQKIILIPDATIRHDHDSRILSNMNIFENKPLSPPSFKEQTELLGRLNKYWSLAKNDPMVVGFFPFIYQSYDEQTLIPEIVSRFYGVEEMPLIKNRMKEIYREAEFINANSRWE